MDCLDLHMSDCLGIKLVNTDSYLLESMAFAKEQVKVDHEGETVWKARWVDLTQETLTDDYIDIHIGSFKKFTKI